MKIPSKIKISGIWFTILFRDTAKDEQVENHGYSDFSNCKIVIDSRLHQQEQESTLIHEIIEVINYRNELGMEHKQIMTLENNLYQVLKDNNLLK